MKKLFLLLGLAFLGLLTLVGACGALVYFGVEGISSREPTEEERWMLLTIEDLADYDLGETHPEQCSTLVARNALEGELSLEYDYDYELGPDCAGIYLVSVAEIHPSVGAARQAYAMNITAYGAGLLVGGGDVVTTEELAGLAEDTYAAYLQDEDGTFGNFLVLREGRVVHVLILTGVFIEDPAELRELYSPILVRSRTYAR